MSPNRASRRPVIAPCRLCGAVGPLSFEHVPPESAFNDQPVRVIEGRDGFSIGPDDDVRGRIQQRGAGAFTLCVRCNTMTGRWYGSAFRDFAYQAGGILQRSGGTVSLVHLYHVLPLRVLKQIVTMFFSVNGTGFAERHPELARFVMSRESRSLPPEVRVFVFYNWEGRYRSVPLQGLLDIRTRQWSFFSEIVMPPLGYVLATGTGPPDERLCEITEWTRHAYSGFAVIPLQMPVLPTHTFIGGDYRPKDQIYREADVDRPRSA